MRISDWSSDVCSSDLIGEAAGAARIGEEGVDIAEARALEARRRRTRTDQVEILAEEARIGGQEVGAAVARRQPAKIGTDDIGLRARTGRAANGALRTGESCVGTECVGTWRSWWSPYHS